jgi:hypothetical protein
MEMKNSLNLSPLSEGPKGHRNEEPDKPVVEPVIADIEEMDVDDVVNHAEKIVVMKNGTDEDVSQERNPKVKEAMILRILKGRATTATRRATKWRRGATSSIQ